MTRKRLLLAIFGVLLAVATVFADPAEGRHHGSTSPYAGVHGQGTVHTGVPFLPWYYQQPDTSCHPKTLAEMLISPCDTGGKP